MTITVFIKDYFKRVSLLLLCAVLITFSQKVHSRIAPQTTYDGVTKNFNSYLDFKGNSGLRIGSSASDISEYTLSVWFKLSKAPWEDKSTMTLIQLGPRAFYCTLSYLKRIQCISDRGGQYMIEAEPRVGSWYMLVIKSKQGASEIQFRELNYRLLISDSRRDFFPFGESSLSFDEVHLGIRSTRRIDSFIGNLRNLRIFKTYYDDNVIQNIQYIKLYPFGDMIFDMDMANLDDLQNKIDLIRAQIVGEQSQIEETLDYMGIWQCLATDDEEINFLKLDPSFTTNTYTIPSGFTDSNNQVTMQAWIFRNKAENPTTDETLIDHNKLLKVKFPASDNSRMQVKHLDNAANQYSFPVAFNQWIFMSVVSVPSKFTVSIFDNAGKQIIFQDNLSKAQPSGSLPRNLLVGKNFNGLIKGIKYFREAKSDLAAYEMTSSLDASSSNLLFYFYFTPSWYNQNRKILTNLARQYFGNDLEMVGNAQTIRKFYNGLGSTQTYGTIGYQVNFDGYTCADDKSKLFFPDSQSFAQSDINVSTPLSEFTVEFWVKTDGKFYSNAFFINLAEKNSPSIQYLTIRQERQSKLYCQPFANSKSYWELSYVDFNENQSKWMHVSCAYDNSRSLVRGHLFNGNNFLYQFETDGQLQLSSGDYLLTINNEPRRYQTGATNVFYSEVRFWKTARSIQEIQVNRFQQLDILKDRSSLVSYIKLFNGGFSQAQEIDFVDPSHEKAVTLSNVQWRPNTDIVICPLHMFKSESENICFREGLLSLDIVTMRVNNGYLITPTLSRYRNSYVRSKAKEIYDFSWSLDRIDSGNQTDISVFPDYWRPQSNNMELFFSESEVASNPGSYTFSLRIIDKNRYQTQQQVSYRLKTLNCLKIFDKETQESFITQDINVQQGTQHVYLNFGQSSCGNYEWDPSLLSFQYDTPGLTASASDIDTNNLRFRIRRVFQNSLPLNEYFYVIGKGGWKNRQDSNDVIQANVVYKLRFIMKLAISLTPNSDLMLVGETLSISSRINFINLNQQQTDQTYTLKWICPQSLNRFCGSTGSSLRLTYDLFLSSGLQFWKRHPITLEGTTNFIQGNGERRSNQTVFIMWLPLDVQAEIIQKSDRAFEIRIENLDEDDLSIKWSINPSLPPEALLNSDDRKQFVIDPEYLTEGTTYEVISELTYTPQNQVIWSESVTFTVPKTPAGGNIGAAPLSGEAITTNFQLSANQFETSVSPVTYQWYFENNNGQKIPISPILRDIQFNTRLPATKKLFVKVTDGNNAFSFVDINILVEFQNQGSTTESIESLMNSIENSKDLPELTEVPNLVQQASIVASSINDISSYLGISQAKGIVSTITTSMNNLVKNFEFLPDVDSQAYLLQGSMQIFSQVTNNTQLFNASQASEMQDVIMQLQQYSDTWNRFLVDELFHESFVETQSNILYALNQRYTSGLLELGENVQIGNVTAKLRQLLTNYEQYRSIQAVEGEKVLLNTDSFKVEINKYSQMKEVIEDYSESLYDDKLSYTFPLSGALRPTERQSLTAISFKSNPFFGDTFLNQTATSNNSVYFAYRDQNGQYLGNEYVGGPINMTFYYEYKGFKFLPNLTVCGHINVGDSMWGNSSCSTTFDRENSQVSCSCKHMSYYAVIDDFLSRPQVQPIVFLTFRNWPSFAVFIYILFIFIIGVIYTHNKDNQDFRQLHDQEENQGNQLSQEDSLTLLSIAFRRKVFFMGFSEKYSFGNLYKIYIMLLHPLFQLKYRLDPQLPRFYRFLVLFTRVMIIFCICFFSLRKHPNLDLLVDDDDYPARVVLVIIYILVCSLIFIPLPDFVYWFFTAKYFLVTPREVNSEDSERDDGGPNKPQPKQEQIEVDPNLPIKLLFLINAVPLNSLSQNHKEKIPFASGNFKHLGRILQQLEFDPANSGKNQNIQSAANQTERNLKSDYDSHDSQRQLNTPPRVAQVVPQRNSRQRGSESQHEESKQIDQPQPKPDFYMVNHNDIQFEMQEDNIQEDSEQYNAPSDNYSGIQHEGGEVEEAAKPQIITPLRIQNNQIQPSEEESLNTEMFTNEKKELVQKRNRLGRIFGGLLALAIIAVIWITVLITYVEEEYYNESTPYVWVVVFFLSQVAGFFITDFIALWIMACCASKCCRRKKTCLAYTMRESLSVYEDYRYVVHFTQTKLT